MDWKSLSQTKDKKAIADLIKSGIIAEALKDIHEDLVLTFLKQVVNPLIFTSPECLDGIKNIFDRNCPNAIRLWVGYLYLEYRLRSTDCDYSVNFRDVCDIVHSSLTFQGDTNHHLIFLFIKLDDHQFRPATTSLLMQRLLGSFEIGPLDSFQVILQWLLIKVRSVSRIREFTVDLVVKMAVLCPDWVKKSPDAMELLIDYDLILNASDSKILLISQLITSYRTCPASCLFALLDKCVEKSNLWGSLQYLSDAFRKLSEKIYDLPSQFEVKYPYLILSMAQKIILVNGNNVSNEEVFVIYMLLIYDSLKSSHLLVNIPAMRETMEAITGNPTYRGNLAIACGWAYNRMSPNEFNKWKTIRKEYELNTEFLKTILIVFDRLYASLKTFGVKASAVIHHWEMCKSNLAILAISPLAIQEKKLSRMIITAITHCLSIIFKAVYPNRAGIYFNRQRIFLLTMVTKLDTRYTAKELLMLFKDPLANIQPYSNPNLCDIIE